MLTGVTWLSRRWTGRVQTLQLRGRRQSMCRCALVVLFSMCGFGTCDVLSDVPLAYAYVMVACMHAKKCRLSLR